MGHVMAMGRRGDPGAQGPRAALSTMANNVVRREALQNKALSALLQVYTGRPAAQAQGALKNKPRLKAAYMGWVGVNWS